MEKITTNKNGINNDIYGCRVKMNGEDREVKEKQTLTVDHRRPPANRDGKISDRAIKKLLIHLNILNTLKEYA